MLGGRGVSGAMRKIITVLFLVFSLLPVFAETDPYKTQTISGYVDDISYLYVSPFRYNTIVLNGYAGINLDTTDTTNSNPFKNQVNLIKPVTSSTPVMGLQIGSFTVLATYKNTTLSAVNLVITHTKLIHTTNTSAQLDYELGVLYSISDGTVDPDHPATEVKTMCLSTGSISISLMKSTGIASIQNGYLYFRLKDTPTVTGQYESAVTFSLEVL